MTPMTKKTPPERVTLQLLQRQVDAMEERLAALEPKKKPAETKGDDK